jgi:hypothetical protein
MTCTVPVWQDAGKAGEFQDFSFKPDAARAVGRVPPRGGIPGIAFGVRFFQSAKTPGGHYRANPGRPASTPPA